MQTKSEKLDENWGIRNVVSSHENIKMNIEQNTALQSFSDPDPYKASEIKGVAQSTSSTVKFPPAQVRKVSSIKDSSSVSLKNSTKNRSKPRNLSETT